MMGQKFAWADDPHAAAVLRDGWQGGVRRVFAQRQEFYEARQREIEREVAGID